MCSHNTMVANDSPTHAWKCAECGYVYGESIPEPFKIESYAESVRIGQEKAKSNR